MTWDNDVLDRLGSTPELHITSLREDGTARRWTPIWVVRVGDELYIRSAYGSEGGWYRNAMKNRAARIRANGVETDVTLTPEPSANTEVDAAYRAKYRSQPSSLEPMLAPAAAGSTVRLDAAG
ncbi:DUF2255 family protein [Amycolatopsis australiensis]|uniref:Deazaflavin-dependent oxidoreductase, nitroreductase family n=1 Tax=Amycolatopsis australiensis TaxID=546364 RepID=A0A1K1S6E3_9PSEU|nr:DUF2255 family protein [Amycolatopsis australiensis]SFW79923.1 hypothetical protein SAMN04489730_4866 [Amycolatopsis australiensis]